MLRDIWAPSDLVSLDKDPSVPVEEKLSIIATTPVTVTPWTINGKTFNDTFSVSLPFVSGGSFSNGLGENGNHLVSDYINVGDKQLHGYGIGSRLLRAAIRYSVEQDERTDMFCTGWIRLGMVNTVVGVVGEENVAVMTGSNRYGWQGDKSLEEVFDDFPPVPGQPYILHELKAHIDHDLVITWDTPKYTSLSV